MNAVPSPVDDNDQELVPLRPPLPRRRRRGAVSPVVGGEGGGDGGGQGEAGHDQAPIHAGKDGSDSLAKEDHDGGGVIPNNPAKKADKKTG